MPQICNGPYQNDISFMALESVSRSPCPPLSLTRRSLLLIHFVRSFVRVCMCQVFFFGFYLRIIGLHHIEHLVYLQQCQCELFIIWFKSIIPFPIIITLRFGVTNGLDRWNTSQLVECANTRQFVDSFLYFLSLAFLMYTIYDKRPQKNAQIFRCKLVWTLSQYCLSKKKNEIVAYFDGCLLLLLLLERIHTACVSRSELPIKKNFIYELVNRALYSLRDKIIEDSDKKTALYMLKHYIHKEQQ